MEYYDTDLIRKIINEMRDNEALWNAKDPKFSVLNRLLAFEEASKRLKIPEKRCRNIVNYVKSQHTKEHKRRKDQNLTDEEADKDKKSWKWYKQCKFLNARLRFTMKRDKLLGNVGNPMDVLVIDPDTEFVCKSSNESEMEENCAEDLPGSTESGQSKPEVNQEKNKFLIDGICSSMKYQLSNSNFSEDKLMAFHSDIVKYMHCHFKKGK